MFGAKQQNDNQMFYQPEMQQEFKQLNETNYYQILFQMPQLIEDNDWDGLYKNGIVFSRNLFFSVVLGITANVQIKKIPKYGEQFLQMNYVLRQLLRIPIFFVPYFLIFHKKTQLQIEDLNKNYHQKYWSRIYKFQKTGDIRDLDPTSSLRRKFEQQQGMMQF